MQSARKTEASRHQQNSSPTRGPKDDHGPRSIRILLVDDQVIFRELFRIWLTLDPDVEVVGEADNGRDALRLATTLHPTLVLTELSLPGTHGVDLIGDMKHTWPRIKILALTSHVSEPLVRATLQAGASGFLVKNASLEEVKLAIRGVMEGKTYFDRLVADKLVHGYVNDTEPLEMLTQRERETLKCLAEGMRNKDIAARLCISVKTVKKHRANLMEKLNLRKVATLTAFAIEQGLISAIPNGSAPE